MNYRVILLLLFLPFISAVVLAQKQMTYQIKADSIRIFSNCDTAELILENRTRSVVGGVLTNKGNGVTEFRKITQKINDSLYVIGADTLNLATTGKNIYTANGSLISNREVDGNNKILQFKNNNSYIITNNNHPVVLSRVPLDSATLYKINNSSAVAYSSGLAVRGDGCDASITLVSDSAGTCNEVQTIDFATLRPRNDSWVANSSSGIDKNLVARIQVETSPTIADYSLLKFAVKSDTAFYHDGAYVLYSAGSQGGFMPYPVMSVNPSFKHPTQGYNTKMPFVKVNGGLFIGYGRDWYYNSRNANDIIASVDDVPGYLQAFYETRFSVYADSLPLKIYKLPQLNGSAFLTYSPTHTVEGNNVAFEYKDTVYEDIRNYISMHGLTTPSDFNLKENISASQFNTDKLFGLPVKDFNYKTDTSKTRYTGLIAQELKLKMPELVFGKEGHYSIDYIKMVPYLLKAIQEQQLTIQQQQKEIDGLKQQQPACVNSITDVLVMLQQMQQQLLQQQEEIKSLKNS